jgi:hypothetical protein
MRTCSIPSGFLLLGLGCWTLAAQLLETKPDDPFFAKFSPVQAPAPAGLALKPGDRLAICGDSITEQKMYSRIIETYLTVCVPELDVTVRQFGWSGERAPGFLARMTNDCLRFRPTIATTCYGMNDHEYRRYEDRIGRTYRESSTLIVQAFKAHGARVILGSPGCVGKNPSWSEAKESTMEDLNLNLCRLRNLGIEIAAREEAGFADVFWPMLVASFEAQKKYGAEYAVPGKDGVHPDWAGQLVMAYAFLKAFGLDGDLGIFTVDLVQGSAAASAGHRVDSFQNGELQITSRRYPFCTPAGDAMKDNNLRSGMTLVPFNAELNRLQLVVKKGSARSYRVTWSEDTRSYSAEQLAKGVNLAEDFVVNPFSVAFKKVDEAVAAKQSYETRQIKDLFHGPEGRTDPEMTAALTEKVRAPLTEAIKSAFVPVTHTIKIAAE